MLKWRWIARLLPPERFEVVQHKFSRYGNRVLFVARFLPGMRTTIYLTAGTTRQVSLLRFLLIDAAAALISVPVWVYLGFFGADNHVWLMKWMHRGQNSMWVLVGLVLLCAAWLWWRYRRQRISQDD
jgi:membrane protein DedA with SNARE-associated domain